MMHRLTASMRDTPRTFTRLGKMNDRPRTLVFVLVIGRILQREKPSGTQSWRAIRSPCFLSVAATPHAAGTF